MKNRNQMFSNMLQVSLNWLEEASPEEISQKTGISFDGTTFRLESLGVPVTISYPNYQITPTLDQWHCLTLLHYLHLADGTPLTNKQISFSDYKDGMIRGSGFDYDVERTVSQKLGSLHPKELERRCRKLGGKLLPSNADFCVEFSFAPNYPIWLKIWFADEEFPASGRMLLNASSEHYLSIEDAVTLGALILEKLLFEGEW